MLSKSPSGALSPYYYKGGYFHGIHYGSYFDNYENLFEIMDAEEKFILNGVEKRLIMIDLYETKITKLVLDKLLLHLENLTPKIKKLAISSDKPSLKKISKAIKREIKLKGIPFYFTTDMEEGKTWLVSNRIN